MPAPAEALVLLLWVQDPSVKTVTSWGGRRVVGCQVGFRDLFLGLVKIHKFSWILPEDNSFRLESLTSSGGPIAWVSAAFRSSMGILLLRGFVSSYGLNFGDRLDRIMLASFKQRLGWGHPEDCDCVQ